MNWHQLLTTYFPECAFLVAKFDGGKADILVEVKLEQHEKLEPITEEDETNLRKVNEQGYSVFFTPNAVKESRGEGKTHALENFHYVNACYLDLDITDTKQCVFEEDFARRAKKKAEIAGKLFTLDLEGKPMPSLVVESRNGFQIFWFTTCKLPDFHQIQTGLYQYFKEWGADPACRKEVQLMRVPSFLHNKEPIVCEIREELSEKYPDGSYKWHHPADLLKAFPVAATALPAAVQRYTASTGIFKHDIFTRIIQMPILDVLQKISGTELVGGDVLTFTPTNNGKVQILCNGKASPNWIDLDRNMVFSNTIKGFANVFHYCMYYGFDKATLAEKFKSIYPMK